VSHYEEKENKHGTCTKEERDAPHANGAGRVFLVGFEEMGWMYLIVFDQPRLYLYPGSERVLRTFLNQKTEQRCWISGIYTVERLANGAICLHGATRSTALSVAATERLREMLNHATQQEHHHRTDRGSRDSGQAGRGAL
jgi:hypothetical protein